MHRQSPLLLFLLAGCGDSLISGESLESLLGLTPLPSSPAWEVRWYSGPESELVVDCALYPTEIEQDDVYWENLYGVPPEIEEPAVWVEADEYRYAIALLLLADVDRYVSVDEMEESDEGLEFWRGIWGGVQSRALLFAEGDLDAMAEDALLLPDAIEVAEDEPIWLGLLPELAAVKEDLSGALYPLPEDEDDGIDELGLEVTPTEYLSESAYEVLTGAILGDGVSSGCPE